MRLRTCTYILMIGILSIVQSESVLAQVPTENNNIIDSFLLKKKGLFGRLAKNLLARPQDDFIPIPTHVLFSFYDGKPIRKVHYESVEFGRSITDTSKVFQNFLTKAANTFHTDTRSYVIRHQVFFREGDMLNAYLLADNERHLRDLPYLQDAKIKVKYTSDLHDSVDVYVYTKDVFSYGASVNLHSIDRVTLVAENENIGGWGDQIALSSYIDYGRSHPIGLGAQFTKRNVAGTFIDIYGGYHEYMQTLEGGLREEVRTRLSVNRPLVHSYLRFIYGADWLRQKNLEDEYRLDTAFTKRMQYDKESWDVYAAYNLGSYRRKKGNSDNRYRMLLGARYFNQYFLTIPDSFRTEYSYKFHNLSAYLVGLSLFKQNFYRTNYVYGFGRSEDVPEGVDIQLNTGVVRRYGRERAYVGVGFRLQQFTAQESYLDYTFKLGGHFNDRSAEDLSLLVNFDMFTRLHQLGSKWKHRFFGSLGFTAQHATVLNEPLWLESSFGLPELYNQRTIFGNSRATLKLESVFFSPVNLMNFKLAPFTFARFSYLTPPNTSFFRSHMYSSVGGGLRSRNESLIFGTMEFKFFYFPEANYRNEHWRFEFKTNIRFKYNQPIIKRPELVNLNESN